MPMTAMILIKYGVIGPKFTEFLHDVTKASILNLLKSELQYSNVFRNARATNEGDYSDFTNFDPKIGRHGNIPQVIGKRGSIQ